MTALHDYEAWLDTLDEKLFAVNGVIRSEFDHAVSIPLSECANMDGLKFWAAELCKTLRLNRSSHLPMAHLLKRFLRLATMENSISITPESIMGELRQEWNIKNEFNF
ncbi:hypothetical protein V9K97_03165 [Variovorax sp. CCNWLW186]|uniref:hypothetical protein n=1 Tax=Variovorax sp. CCNWLW186 TaxID=3127473 RepID=UPI0030776821